jgi:predicted O-methyltransferase YrrM
MPGRVLGKQDRVLDAISQLSPRLAAAIDWIQPSAHFSWGAMNGQARRRAMIQDLVRLLAPTAVVETGTYRGNTTEFLADIVDGAPVYSAEAAPRYHTFARWRLANRPQIHLALEDSRRFLRRLASDASVPKERVLFYLDAHWEEDLPLAEELSIINASWRATAVVIDDFQVPGDPGYAFDDYGSGARLDEDLLPDDVADWVRLYPTASSADETGYRRGCVVLLSPDVSVHTEHLSTR